MTEQKSHHFYGTVRSKSEYRGRNIDSCIGTLIIIDECIDVSGVILRIKSTTVTPLFNELSVSIYKYIELSMYLCGESKIKVGNQLLKQF